MTTALLTVAALAVLAVVGCTDGSILPVVEQTPTEQAQTRQPQPFTAIFSIARVDEVVLFLGSDSSIHWSDDGGNSWNRADSPQAYVYEFASTVEGENLFSATSIGLLQSDDFGESWQEVAETGFSNVTSVVVQGETVAITGDHVDQGSGTFISSDSGETWEVSPGGPAYFLQLGPEDAEPSLVGTTDDALLIKRTGDDEWSPVVSSDSLGVGTYTYAEYEEPTAFIGGGRNTTVHRAHAPDWELEDLGFTLSTKADGCGDGTATGDKDPYECYQPIEVTPTFSTNGHALAVSRDGLLSTQDWGRTWEPVDLPLSHRVLGLHMQQNIVFSGPAYAHDGAYLASTPNSEEGEWRIIGELPDLEAPYNAAEAQG